MNRFILSVKRGNTPFYRLVRAVLKRLARPPVPHVPGFLRPVLRFFYELHYLVIGLFRVVLNLLYRGPLFSARCAKVGRNVSIDKMPFVSGHVQIELGDDVWIGGNVSILSGRIFDQPSLIVGDRSSIGWGCVFTVNREVIIEDHVMVAYDCRISDSDAHPKEIDQRIALKPPAPEEIRPVHICRGAWIGNGAHILKGVTIGEGAIIGANSVVISDVPAYSLAVGNPARVFLKDVGLPSTAKPVAPDPPK